MYTWGEGAAGPLGHGEACAAVTDQPRRLATLDGISVKQVVCGGDFTFCAAGSDLLGFGANDMGTLGLGPGAPLRTFKPRPVPLFRSLSLPVAHVACGSDFVLAATFLGTVYAFGSNAQGRLGLGPKCAALECSSPQLIESLAAVNVVQVAAGEGHGLALTAGGSVYAWGRNKAGQLGLGCPALPPIPTMDRDLEAAFAPESKAPVMFRWAVTLAQMGFDRRAAEAAIAATHSRSLEDALEWALAHPAPAPSTSGRAAHKECTAPEPAPKPLVGEEGTATPKRIPHLPRIMSVAAAGSHSVALDVGGRVYTFGRGRGGQLGLGSLEDQPAPKRVGMEVRVAAVACGSVHTLALTREGRLLGCGSNESGQLGHLHGASHVNEFVDLQLQLPHGAVITDFFAGSHCTALTLTPAATEPPPPPLPSPLTAADRLRELVARAAAIDPARDYETKAVRERAVKDVVAMIDQVFRSPSAVAAVLLPRPRPLPADPAPSWPPPPDVAALSDLYRALLELVEPSVIQALLKALGGLTEAIRDGARLME